MPRSWFAVQALAPAAAEINLRGIIGEWGLTDADLIAEIELLGDLTEITLRINSRGGDVAQALGLFNYLRSHAARVVVRIEGVAMSAATIVMMAADHIVMPSNTLLMIHNPFYTEEDLPYLSESAREGLAIYRDALIETYAARTRLDRTALGALLDDETFMSPGRALELGFADEVEQVSAVPNALAVMACAVGIPDDVVARLQVSDALADPAPEPEPAPSLSAPHASLASQVQSAAAELGLAEFAPVFAVAQDITDAASARAALVLACEVRDLCVAAGMTDQTSALIRARMPAAQARAQLAAVLAERDEQAIVSNTPPAHGTGPAPTAQQIWAKVIPTTVAS